DVEVVAVLAVVVDFRHHPMRAMELLLQDGAVPFGVDLVASVGAQHQLERHRAVIAQTPGAPDGTELAVIERLAFNRLKVSDVPHASSGFSGSHPHVRTSRSLCAVAAGPRPQVPSPLPDRTRQTRCVSTRLPRQPSPRL